jgi:hypothetical protein
MLQGYKLNPAFGKWVSNQRTSKKKGRLSEEQIAKLDDIGFAWVASSLSEEQIAKLDSLGFAWQRWHVMYKELKAFKETVRAILFLLLKIATKCLTIFIPTFVPLTLEWQLQCSSGKCCDVVAYPEPMLKLPHMISNSCFRDIN